MTPAELKRRLRAEARAHRSRLAATAADAASRAAAHLAAHPLATLAPSAVVSGYLPFGDEFDCLPCLAHFAGRGHPTALPVVIGKGRPLEFRRWAPGEPLGEGVWGIPVPGADAPPVTPTFLLVPLLAFDAQGHRLGYGGGFYDRTLAALRAASDRTLALGVAYAGQRVDAVPRDEHDARLDGVLTEDGVSGG